MWMYEKEAFVTRWISKKSWEGDWLPTSVWNVVIDVSGKKVLFSTNIDPNKNYSDISRHILVGYLFLDFYLFSRSFWLCWPKEEKNTRNWRECGQCMFCVYYYYFFAKCCNESMEKCKISKKRNIYKNQSSVEEFFFLYSFPLWTRAY